MKSASFLCAAVVLAGLASSGGAWAFTYDNHTNTNPDGSAKFQDPDDLTDGQAAKTQKKSGFSFGVTGGQTSLNPIANRYFVPSANSQMNSPFAPSSSLWGQR